MAKRPQDLVPTEEIKPSDFYPFLDEYLDDETANLIDGDTEVHYPSDYEPGYKDMEDPYEDSMSFYPTNKKGIVYVISNAIGDGYTTPDNVARYMKENFPYFKQQWEKNNRR